MQIDSAPEVEDLAVHLDLGFIQMQFVAGLGSVATDDVGEQETEPLLPS